MAAPQTQTDFSDIVGGLQDRVTALESATNANLIRPGMLTWCQTFTKNIPFSFVKAEGQELVRADYPEAFDFITLQTSVTTTNGSTTATFASSSDAAEVNPTGAWKIEGTGIAAGTTVSNVSGTTLTLSANANATGTATLRFFPCGNGNGSTTFNAPDMRDNVGAGINTGAAEYKFVNQFQGEKTHTLTGAESGLPAHTISGSSIAAQLSISAHTWSTQGHSNTGTTSATAGAGDQYVKNWVNAALNNHTISGSGSVSISAANAANAHNNLQPSKAGYWLFKLDPV